MFVKYFLITFSIFFLISCSTRSKPIYYGLGAGAVGATAGAVTGFLIKNGDIPLSAAFGASIGIPVGIIATSMYLKYQENYKLRIIQETIDGNKQKILENNRSLEKMREDTFVDSMQKADPEDREYIYTGATKGVMFR